MSASNWVHLDVERIMRETDMAFLLLIEGQQHWVPKTQISDPESLEEGDENVTVSVTEWIAGEKGLG